MYKPSRTEYSDPATIAVAISFSRGYGEKYRRAIINTILEQKLKRKYNVKIYADYSNNGGDNIDPEINWYFRNADIIICLVSNGFLKNTYVNEFERPIIVDFGQYSRTDKKVIPIIMTRTSNFESSWMGNIRITTLPDLEALKKPFSSYPFKLFAHSKIAGGLEKAFLDFQDKVVIPRLGSNYVYEPKNTSKKYVVYILLAFILLFLVYLGATSYIETRERERQEEIEQERIQQELARQQELRRRKLEEEKLQTDILRREQEKIKRVEDQRDDKQVEEIAVREEQLVFEECNAMSSQSESFPRNLSDYKYFGKENYGRFESCQGLNKDGWKPCKRNRNWYMVNEKLNKNLKLKINREMHKDIFAIRPLHNGVAEVYYHDGKNMYLSYCVTIDSGEPTVD